MPLRMAAAQAALAMTAARFGLRRALAFLPRIGQARQFARTLPATLGLLPAGTRPDGPVSAGHVHGGMTSAQRELVLDRLRHPPEGGWAVVANARCLGEGVDVPAIDSVLFAAPKESVIDIMQIAGRALRPHGDARYRHHHRPGPAARRPATTDGDGGRRRRPVPARAARRAGAVRARRHPQPPGWAPPAPPGRRHRRRPGGQQLPAQIIVQAPAGTLARTLDALRVRIIDGTAPPGGTATGTPAPTTASTATSTSRPRSSPPAGSGSGPG